MAWVIIMESATRYLFITSPIMIKLKRWNEKSIYDRGWRESLLMNYALWLHTGSNHARKATCYNFMQTRDWIRTKQTKLRRILILCKTRILIYQAERANTRTVSGHACATTHTGPALHTHTHGSANGPRCDTPAACSMYDAGNT